jgi:DNA (cytosine-5)-methyltransferase 1
MGPRFVLVENVPGLLDRGMGDVLGTLSDLGYDAEWSLVSACSVGAAHMRQRLFIVAYSNRIDGRQGVRHTVARAFGPLQEVGDFASARAGALSRLADPSALYGGADGIPDGPQRNRAIGNAVAPDVAEWIGRRLLEAAA